MTLRMDFGKKNWPSSSPSQYFRAELLVRVFVPPAWGERPSVALWEWSRDVENAKVGVCGRGGGGWEINTSGNCIYLFNLLGLPWWLRW